MRRRRRLVQGVAFAVLVAGFAWSRIEAPAPVASAEASNTDAPSSVSSGTHASSTDAVLARAFDERRSDLQVRGIGVVEKVLPDDNDGGRHQRFILRLHSGQTLLVAHNIDLARRLDALAHGDTVEFNGEYEWNASGGVIHWTHRDPAGRHEHGWLRHKGRTVQ